MLVSRALSLFHEHPSILQNNENGNEASNYFIGGLTADMDVTSKENIAIKSRLLGARYCAS